MTTEKNDLSPSVRERIRKDAEDFENKLLSRSGNHIGYGSGSGYIAGAESEHPKAIAAYREGLRKAVEDEILFFESKRIASEPRSIEKIAAVAAKESFKRFLSILDQP